MKLDTRLQKYIKSATDKGVYSTSVSNGLISAVKFFASVMTPDEARSEVLTTAEVDYLVERAIQKYGDRLTPKSYSVYRSRFSRVLADYQSKSSPKSPERQAREQIEEPVMPSTVRPLTTDITLPLKDGREVVIKYPLDMSTAEAENVGAALRGVVALQNS